MSYIITTDTPVLWAVGDPVIASGLTEPGGCTVSGLPMVTGNSETDFEQIVGAAVYEALVEALDYPVWGYGLFATTVPLTIVWHNDLLWRCVQSHTVVADPNYAPGIAHSLWARYFASNEIPAWVQPQGAHDAYPDGFKVLHEGHTWESQIPANVWVPGSAGAELYWTCLDCEPQPGVWAVGIAYVGDNPPGSENGDKVTHNGHLWRCLQSHTSISTWYPGAPGVYLWTDLGPI